MIAQLSRRAFSFVCIAVLAACAAERKPAAAPDAGDAPLVSAAPSASTAPRPTDPVHFVILHTNDVHGQVLERKATWLDKEDPPPIGGLERLAAEVSAQRRQAESEGAQVIVVDGGDWYQGTPEGVIDQGRPFVEALMRVGYDAVSLGNHDFDHGIANLRRILASSHAPALASNVRDARGKRIDWVEPWRIVERAGLKVAIVGFLTPSTPFITHKDASALSFERAAAEYGTVVRELAGSVDWILPIGHIAVEEAVELAERHPEIPLIVSGHSHTYLKEGQLAGKTLIVQTGAKASALGRVDLWFDPTTNQVLSLHAELIDLLHDNEPFDRDPELARRCAELVEQAKADMATVVGELTAPVTRSKGFSSSTAGNWTTDLMRKLTGADVAIHNKGGIRTDIQAGKVTRRDLFEIAPFDNTVVSFELTGAELDAVVRGSTEGPKHSGLEYSGLVVRARSDAAGDLTVVAIEVGGKPLDPAARYRVATNSFLAGGGDAMDVFKAAGARREEPLLVREMLEWGLVNSGPVTPPNDARCVLVP
ncbi:MAG: bifunctional metallophosphatase/5'-nucleotidase [Planctomycetes bacterium]|nr:bifunctional metallophosphatase/5'-nucleotidase [Planctomycetota bacterium]